MLSQISDREGALRQDSDARTAAKGLEALLHFAPMVCRQGVR